MTGGLAVEPYGCVPGEHRPLVRLPERWVVMVGVGRVKTDCQCGQVWYEAALPNASREGGE